MPIFIRILNVNKKEYIIYCVKEVRKAEENHE